MTISCLLPSFALFCALENIESRQMLELLLKAGSDINAQNIVGDAPLHKAAMNGRARAADYLICSGANVNIRNAFDQTPLHSACVSGNIEVVQRLVQGGADTSAQDAAEVREEERPTSRQGGRGEGLFAVLAPTGCLIPTRIFVERRTVVGILLGSW